MLSARFETSGVRSTATRRMDGALPSMRFSTLNLTLIAWLLLILCLSGCTQFDLKRRIPWAEGSDGMPQAPMKVVACWTDTVMQTEGKPSMRGFGGRLSFYAQNDPKPVKIDGTLVIYAFDETDGNKSKVMPDRKFVFDAEQIKKHHSKDDRGHSYSFWIPWDVAGGEPREISLIARFTPVQGGIVVSEQTRHLLPGTTPQIGDPTYTHTISPPVNFNSAVQQAGFSEPAQGGPAPAERKMSTTTIDLPRRSALQPAAGPQAAQTPLADGQSAMQPAPPEFGSGVTGPATPQAAAAIMPAGGSAAAAQWTQNAPQGTGGFKVSVSNTPPPGSALTAKWQEQQRKQQQSAALSNHFAPSGRFAPPRLRPQGGPLARLEHGHDPWQPRQLESPSGQTSLLQQGTQSADSATSGAAPLASR
jgi:hypothetical protein